MGMKWQSKVHKFQFDVTSHCNARCGACVRNKDGGDTEPELALNHFDIDLWKRICTKDTKGWYIGQLALNGNWGDPMMHPNLVEMVRIWIENHPETFITINTNGSMRGEKFWFDLAKQLRKYPAHQVNFAVDGLEDTHHIYRRRTDFKKIIQNIKSFNEAGGSGRIIMTLFEHNQHQVEELKNLAETLKCRQFVTRSSHQGGDIRINDKDEKYVIKKSNMKEQEWWFEQNDEFTISDQPDSDYWMHITEVLKDSKFMNETKCPWYNEGEIQIDPFGTVWPCCHVSLYGVNLSKQSLKTNCDETIIERRTENSLFKYSLQEILSNDWYNHHLDTVVKEAKWEVCKRSCGVC
jgi:MoaA/NifB/PqqE/SkfB family radical SAM enzyme